MIKTIARIAVALSIFAGTVGIAGSAAASTSVGDYHNNNSARVRVVHASPDAPKVDVYVNGKRAFRNVAFKEVTRYAELKPATYLFQVVPAGASLSQGPIVISASATLSQSTDYTIAATGVLTSIAPLILVDNNTMPAKGSASIRFVHLSPNAPAVDIVALPSAGNLAVWSNIAFQGVGAYTTIPDGTYYAGVRVTGTDSIALNVPNLHFRSGTVYTIYAFGLVGGKPALSAGVSVDNRNDHWDMW